VDELKEILTENDEDVAQNEEKVRLGSGVGVRCEEDSDIESRKNNAIMYKLKEIDSEIGKQETCCLYMNYAMMCLKWRWEVLTLKRCSGREEESKERRSHYWSELRDLKNMR